MFNNLLIYLLSASFMVGVVQMQSSDAILDVGVHRTGAIPQIYKPINVEETNVKVTPSPEPEVVTFNSSCILAKMAIQLHFGYETVNKTTNYTFYNIPKGSVVEDAHCDSNVTQILQVNWGPTKAQNIMTMQFENNRGITNLTMIMFSIPVTNDSFPNAKANQTIQLIHRGGDFSAPSKMSYHCTHLQVFNLTDSIPNSEPIGVAKFHDVQVEAFRASNQNGFSAVHDCDATETSDAVPIAVGVALMALIIIVLISYLCARHRSSSRGYMSF